MKSLIWNYLRKKDLYLRIENMFLKVFILILMIKMISSDDSCELHTNCADCIRDPDQCQWCSSLGVSWKRCRSTKLMNDYPECSAWEKPSSSIQSDPNEKLENKRLEPQKYNIKLRPGQTVHFDFTFKGAEDYPVDMYFLVDVSESMSAVKSAIAEASDKVIQIMKKKTKNVFLGFGSFVDKNAPPYVRVVDSINTYSYRNHLTLTEDVEKFREIVTNTRLGTNQDIPEGGLDALAQVLVCKNVTGWRDVSRKIVLFFTDAPSHSAGDGLLAGIYTPYDGKCYTENNIYTKELDLDYPSIGIINKLAFEQKVTVIFIVQTKTLSSYEVLNQFILDSLSLSYSYTTKQNMNNISFGSNNLEKTLFDTYEKISTKLALYVNMSQKQKQHMKMQIDPDCHKNACEVNGTNEIKFKGNLTLSKYFGEDDMDIEISVNGFTDKLTLAVEVIKDCPCAKKKTENSSECYNGGTEVCGICECNSDRYGSMCKCMKNKLGASNADDSTCRDSNGVVCSGIGTCNCGICHCPDEFRGQLCQCDINSCPNQCNGHGNCNCGVCECNPPWKGLECECEEKPCSVRKGKSCNGRGKCSCGACDCDPIAVWDARSQDQSCEMLPCQQCHIKQCQLLQPCAYCQRDLKDCQDICHPDIRVHVDVNTTGYGVSTCDNGKLTQFQYKYLDDVYGISLYVESDKNRVENFIKMGLILLASLIVVGVGTLLAWKFLTHQRDRREYERFLKEQAADNTAVCQNPIYAPATTTFTNPAFRRKSVDHHLND